MRKKHGKAKAERTNRPNADVVIHYIGRFKSKFKYIVSSWIALVYYIYEYAYEVRKRLRVRIIIEIGKTHELISTKPEPYLRFLSSCTRAKIL